MGKSASAWRILLAIIVAGVTAQALGEEAPRSTPQIEFEADSPSAPGVRYLEPVDAIASDQPQDQVAEKASFAAEAPPTESNTQPASQNQFDPGLVANGQFAFMRDCTTCHDADRALNRSKSLAAWRTTVRSMAARQGADVPAADIEPIAVFLASRNGAASDGSGESTGSANSAGSWRDSFRVSAAVSPMLRAGSDNEQNPGFFPQTWITANWQSQTVLSARATMCITCHNETVQMNRIDVAEAALNLDLARWANIDECCGVKASVEGGRFIVPFGAFSAQVNPGVYRTVSLPLIFNMGQRVFSSTLGDSVLPLPYVDEGARLTLGAPVLGNIDATFDTYAVNGLQGTADGIDFLASRSVTDNNPKPSVGGRATIGNQYLRLGSSIMGGQFSTQGNGVSGPNLNYEIVGVDFSARFRDRLRFQVEYAQRNTDRLANLPGQAIIQEHVGGYYIESELLVWRRRRVSLLARYDSQSRNSPLPPPGSSLTTGTFAVNRITYGVNVVLPADSLLMINLEHWTLPQGLPSTNVFGVRWVATF